MKSLSYLSNIEFLEEKNGEANASVSLNPLYSWAKLTICDSEKNANNQRIREDEFDNMIKTGVFSPIKLPVGGKISDHKDARGFPIGTITQINKSGNRLEGIAAFWKHERPDEVSMLKSMVEAGKLPQVSWEIFYEDSEVSEDGVEDLHGVILNGLAIVNEPAYEGRTSIFAMAQKNSNSEEDDNTMNELDELKQELSTAKETISQKDSQVSDLQKQIEEIEKELKELREYRDGIESEKAKAEKVKSIKDKFNSAGIEKDEDYFISNLDRLLALSDEALDFMVQELVSFASKIKESTSEVLPNLPRDSKKSLDPKDLGKQLRDTLKKS